MRSGKPVATGMACNICSIGRGWKRDSDDRTDAYESNKLRCEAHDENYVQREDAIWRSVERNKKGR